MAHSKKTPMTRIAGLPRASHHKVKTGCLTCKRRRVKCDESKPYCSRCISASITCDGYVTPKSIVFEAPAEKRFKLAQEHRLFDYAWKDGAEILTMYLPPARPFWTLIAPQVSHTHPAVKESMIALGAQLNSLRYRWDAVDQQQDALNLRSQALIHYNKAMKLFAKARPGELSLESLLTCSVMFTGMEMWPQLRMAPHVHISAALELCRKYYWQNDNSSSLAEFMRPFLTALGMTMAAYVDGFPLAASSLAKMFDLQEGWDVPDFFADVGDAHLHVDRLFKRTVILVSVTSPTDTSGRDGLLQICAGLQNAAANSVSQSPHKAQPQFQHGVRALRMHLYVISLMLKTYPLYDEMAFDNHSQSFQRILSECEQLLGDELDPHKTVRPIFHPTFGLLSPLFFVATRCRDPHIRLPALMALHRSSRRERLWNSCVANILATFVINTETRLNVTSGEKSDSLTVGVDKRIRLDSVSFDRDNKKIEISYKHMPFDETTPIKTASVPWNPKIDDSYEAVSLSKKSVAAFGYTGTVLIIPPISCQCDPSLQANEQLNKLGD